MSACRGCGKDIVWGVTEEGKKIPLDPTPPVYQYAGDSVADKPSAIRHKNCMVSHFTTCPKANQFSGGKK